MRLPWHSGIPRGPGVLAKVRQSFGTSTQGGPGEVQIMAGQPTTYGRLPWWIPDVWERYDQVGEFHYVAGFLAGAMSRCTLRLGVLDKDNRVGPAFDEGKPVADVDPALARLGARLISSLRATPIPGELGGGPVGGQGVLLSRMGRNLGAVAECFLLGYDRPNGRLWEVVSTLEIQPMETPAGQPQRFRRRRTRMTGFEEIRPDFCLRVFRSHPAYSNEPDSSNRPLVSVLERLALLDDEGVADSKSRLSGNGVYWLPSEIDFPGDDEDLDNNYISNELIETAGIAIQNPRAASRFVPLVARGPAELLDHIRHDKFDHDNSKVMDKRKAAVSDYARGSDFPPEITTGFGETTFANAFAVSESTSRMHVEPWLDDVVGCLTGGYLTPSLQRYRKLPTDDIPPPEIAKLVVWYDVSGLVSHANPEKVANAGYGTAVNPTFLISESTWRRLNGLVDADAPSPEEVDRRIEIAHQLRMRSEIGGHTDPNTPTPEPGDEGVPQEGTDTDEEVGKRVMALGDFVVRRAVEKAGAWLRSKVAGNRELSARINGADNIDVARILGPQEVERLGSVVRLFTGEFATFERTVRDMFADAGRPDASELALLAVKMVAKVAGARLYTPSARLDAGAAREFLNLLIRDA